MALVGYPLLTGFAYVEKGVARGDAQSAARLAMDAMARELAEAMYVFDPPVGDGFIAFLPARSWSPAPADQKAPIEPGAKAVRYWCALRDPAKPYAPFYGFPIASSVRSSGTGTVTITTYVHHGFNPGQSVTIDGVTPASLDGGFVIATVPSLTSFTYNQPGADESGGGGSVLPPPAINPYYLARTEISDPAKRDDPWNNSGEALTRATYWTWPTSQPGYPWLAAPGDYDAYRGLAVGLTPNSADYNVQASFSPARVTEEALLPWTGAFPRDYSRYRARYPLWVAFAQWNPAAANPAQPFAPIGRIKVYTGSPRTLTYQTVVDATTGKVWVTRVSDGGHLYDISAYPQRQVSDSNQAEFAFGIDYDRGEVLFDFPPQATPTATTDDRTPPRYSLTTATDFVPTLMAGGVVVPGSTSVWITSADGASTYYRLSNDPANVGSGQYAIDGATNEVVFSSTTPPAAGLKIHIRYRYRNNPDNQLVVATYATKAIINIALTVSKRDIAGRTPAGQRQEVSLTDRVKLENVPR